MQTICRSIMLSCLFVSTGCAIKHNYSWSEYPISADRITQNNYVEGQEIKLIKGKSDDSNKVLGSVGMHKYYGNHQLLTDAIVTQLTEELHKKQLKISDMGKKSLEVIVTRTDFRQGAWKIAATIDFTVEFGNGRRRMYTVKSTSPLTVNRVFNGAVCWAVIEILNDSEVLAYFNE